jgi:hypothetical protein
VLAQCNLLEPDLKQWLGAIAAYLSAIVVCVFVGTLCVSFQESGSALLAPDYSRRS